MRLTILVVLLTIFTGVDSAFSISLQDLIDTNGSVVSGSRTFDSFTFLSTNDMPSASQVDVVAIAGGGVRFLGDFRDEFGGSASDALVTFRAIESVGAFTTVQMAGDPEVVASRGLLPQGFVSSTATFLPQDNTLVLSVFAQEPGSQQLTDMGNLSSSHTSLNVQLDFFGSASADGSTAQMSYVDMFAIERRVVPEPTTATLGLLAFGAIVLRRRRC